MNYLKISIYILMVLVLLLSWQFWRFSEQHQQVKNQVLIAGEIVEFDIEAKDSEGITNLIANYYQAYIDQDKAQLAKVLDKNIVWYLHVGPLNAQGTEVLGFDAFYQTIRLRYNNWQNLNYKNNRIYLTKNGFVHSYELSGINIESGPFHAKAVDIFKYDKDKITQRDSYWKIESIDIEIVPNTI